jgi:hypothetical protein
MGFGTRPGGDGRMDWWQVSPEGEWENLTTQMDQVPAPSGPHHPLARLEATKSPLAAGLFDLAVPLAGHAYAGDWKRG